MMTLTIPLLLYVLQPTEPPPTVDLPEPVFEEQIIDDIEIGYGLAIGDVDGDAKPDILLADKSEFAWYRNGDWARFVMCRDLTTRDNVCIAARDIDGDGVVEVAVGGMWNPGNTSDATQSGSVHVLQRGETATDPWTPIALEHDPTVHRMHWARVRDQYHLVVLPLHGIDNRNGQGAGVRIWSYRRNDPDSTGWDRELLDDTMHMTHNFDVIDIGGGRERMIVAGREGLLWIDADGGNKDVQPPGIERGAGEVRFGRRGDRGVFVTTIEPMHGDTLVVHQFTRSGWVRNELDNTFAQGHAIACGDLLGLGRDQIVAGWRNPNRDGDVGINIYVPLDDACTTWKRFPLDVVNADDGDGMACEDLKLADLDGDGRLDIIAAGRATRNLKIYWNRSKTD